MSQLDVSPQDPPPPFTYGFDVDVRVERRHVVVVPRGELDIGTLGRLEAELARVSARAQAVVLDLRQLTFMDSTGLQLLLRMDLAARRRGGSFSIVEADGPVARLLTITGLRDRFHHTGPEPGVCP